MLSVHLENGVVSLREVEPAASPPGFALLRLICAGICNTDLELQRGYYGFAGVPGHEFVAEVVESANPALVGKRVVGEINLACGECGWCARGLGRHCPTRTVLGIVKHPGAFQEYFTLPERNLHVVPDEIPTERAVFVEPLAAACEIFDQVCIPEGEPVAVLGDGKLGLLISMVLAARGHLVHQFGRYAEKLAIAEAAGATTEIAPECLPRAAFDFVVEATGSAEALRQAVAMTRPRGTLILKSTVHGDVPLDTAPVIVNEISLVGSRCGRFEAAMPLLDHPRLLLERMISERFPLSEAPRGFARAAEKGVLKVLLDGVR
jgi:threonine dehydrogenase-like Zn-dependent dehydrogenase